MPKLILEITSGELAELLRLPAISSLLDSGRASVQPDSPLPAESSEMSTRQRGRELFDHRAGSFGLRVRMSIESGAADVIVESNVKITPVRLICSESPRLSLRADWSKTPKLICAYIWLLPSGSRVFFMTYQEVAAVLGKQALESPSFAKNGYYTTACTPRRQQAMEPFEDRWHIFSAKS